MPSVRRVGPGALNGCKKLTYAVFGEKLERIEGGVGVFYVECTALRRIVIPLTDNLIIGNDNDSFDSCEKLSTVDILDGGIYKPISSLHMESLRNEMKDEIYSINQTFPNIRSTEKTEAIQQQQWIAIVLRRI